MVVNDKKGVFRLSDLMKAAAEALRFHGMVEGWDRPITQ